MQQVIWEGLNINSAPRVGIYFPVEELMRISGKNSSIHREGHAQLIKILHLIIMI